MKIYLRNSRTTGIPYQVISWWWGGMEAFDQYQINLLSDLLVEDFIKLIPSFPCFWILKLNTFLHIVPIISDLKKGFWWQQWRAIYYSEQVQYERVPARSQSLDLDTMYRTHYVSLCISLPWLMKQVSCKLQQLGDSTMSPTRSQAFYLSQTLTLLFLFAIKPV